MSSYDYLRLEAKAPNEPTDTVLKDVVAGLILDSLDDRNNLNGYKGSTCDKMLQELIAYPAVLQRFHRRRAWAIIAHLSVESPSATSSSPIAVLKLSGTKRLDLDRESKTIMMRSFD